MNGVENNPRQEDFVRLLKDRIENLRVKLLDLSRRNPLVSARLGRRAGSFVQIVDEMPDVLLAKLAGGSSMRFVSLPSLDDDPRDEQTREFRNALSEARLVDEAYLEQLQQLDPDLEGALDRGEKIERDLKDRVRDRLGMLSRATRGDASLTQHAKNNHISPSFDLPLPKEEREDGRHTDNDIQTLLLPDELERKLNGITTKYRTWIQESGINVLHAAFGFLEWKEPNSDAVCFSPLVLLPVEFEKKRTREGLEFCVKGRGDEAETNLVLVEKLRHDFGIELPIYEGGSIEDYLELVAIAAPSNLNIRMRRQVVFGVFPSSRMAMYHDLDTSAATFEQNNILRAMLIGSGENPATPFEDEYEVDAPEVEQKVPHVVMDADSSQYSALVDLAEGRNIAVEGPPGTGKSQTIVNAIACALTAGKKVLFVAEKMAALDVVKSRLEFVGLGEFVLPLQAERSTKEQVIRSIRDRVEMEVKSDHRDLAVTLENFKTYRAELAEYVSVIGTRFEESGLTVHEILGKNIVTQQFLNGMPPKIQRIDFDRVEDMSFSQLRKIIDAASSLARSWEKLNGAGGYWDGLSVGNIDRFVVEEICDAAGAAAGAFRSVSDLEQALDDFGMERSGYQLDLDMLKSCLYRASITGTKPDADLVDRLLEENAANQLDQFLSDCNRLRDLTDAIGRSIKNPKDSIWEERLSEIERICRLNDFETLNLEELRRRQSADDALLEELEELSKKLRPFFEAFPDCRAFLIGDLQCAADIVEQTGNAVLRLRSETTASPEATVGIRQARKLGERLNKSAEELGKRISLKAVPDPQRLRKLASQIAESGVLRFLSSSYRSAKQAYLELSYASRYDRIAASSDLRATADWLDEKNQLLGLPALNQILGPHNLGLDTDFELFGKLLDFFETVEQRLPGVERLAIRTVLKQGDLDLIVSIPRQLVPAWEGNYESLLQRIEELTECKKSFEEETQKLSALLSGFFAANQLDIKALQMLRNAVVRLHQFHSKLEHNETARKLLRERFSGPDTVAEPVKAELSIAKALSPAAGEWRALLVKLIRRGSVENFRSRLEEYLSSSKQAANLLEALTGLTGQNDEHFREGRTSAQIAEFLEQAIQHSSELYDQSAFAAGLSLFAEVGHPELVNICMDNSVGLSRLPEITYALVARGLAKRVYRDYGSVLGRFHGSKLDDLREKLADADRQIILSTRQMLRQRIKQSASPPPGIRVGRKSELTEWALIENEINKKKRYVPVRELATRSGRALQELKPCWMMSPLAVAQYIPRGSVEFDLCIIDEASQMPPEDAFGALIRSKQTMIVGDTNQLPPTSFFRRMIDEEDADEDESVLDESVLELANASFRPKRRLRWHYRSRHSGLINFSNKLVYDDDLIVFPSAYEDRKDMGVTLVHIDGMYKSGVNGPEARAMIDAALDFMERSPDRSLGIVTLNQKQRDLLIEEMEYSLRNRKMAREYIDRWNEKNDGLQSFFIKNLENVQGDERDVIFIGTVYGPEKAGGPVMQRFGPINGLAGKRRLNVLFSRAREQIITFSSMTAADIRADENGNPGTYMLKRWLEYSATGVLEGGKPTERQPGSDFEVFVIDQIKAMGCEAVPQVGVAGYFIDIGVKHPNWPHGFILGVECDGASYHSSKSARDRDRLRQQVLEDLGWHFHRIWSTDWFNDPLREAVRLRDAITQRLEDLKKEASTLPEAQSATAACPIEEEDDFGEESDEKQKAASDEKYGFGVGVGAGDTVQLRYLSDPGKILEVTLDELMNDPPNGIVGTFEPLGEALLGTEEGDEIDVLIGGHLRRAVVEKVGRKSEVGSTPPRASTSDGQVLQHPEQNRESSDEPRRRPPPANIRTNGSDTGIGENGFTRRNTRFDPDSFYDADYRFTLRDLGADIIDRLGPITHRHLCQKIARLHGFQRTGSQIRKTVWAAVHRERRIQKGPSGENIFWPDRQPPQDVIEFRGLEIGGEARSWGHVPHPEKLGLALEAISAGGNRNSPVEYMVNRLGLARLTTSTREELNELVREAQRLKEGNKD